MRGHLTAHRLLGANDPCLRAGSGEVRVQPSKPGSPEDAVWECGLMGMTPIHSYPTLRKGGKQVRGESMPMLSNPSGIMWKSQQVLKVRTPNLKFMLILISSGVREHTEIMSMYIF